MAIQAQYPSNVLFLNRNVQEEKGQICNNYSSLVLQQTQQQQQLFGEESFLDPTQMLFNPRVESNSSKRGREHTSTTTTTTLMMNPLMSMQQSQPQLIDLTLLPNSSRQQQRTNVVSTGLQLAFGNLQSHQQQQHSVSPQSSILFSLLTDDFASNIKHQQDEIDHFLQVQGEQLRRTLEEKRKLHYHALIGAVEESTARRLREKETEVEKASNRNLELEARASHLSAVARGWQVKVHEQEVTAATLQAQLQQALIRGGMSSQERDNDGGVAEDAESAYVDPDRVVEWPGPSCKVCSKRFASVVMLPCRHLCVCIECDVMAQCCPLCRSIRSVSVQVLLC